MNKKQIALTAVGVVGGAAIGVAAVPMHMGINLFSLFNSWWFSPLTCGIAGGLAAHKETSKLQ